MWVFTVGIWLAIGLVFAIMIYMGGAGTVAATTLGLVLSGAVMILMIGTLMNIGIDPLHIEVLSQDIRSTVDTRWNGEPRSDVGLGRILAALGLVVLILGTLSFAGSWVL